MTSIAARTAAPPTPPPLSAFPSTTSTLNNDNETETENDNTRTSSTTTPNQNQNQNQNKRQTSPSPSPSRPPSMTGRLSFGSKISALGAKITRTLSHSGGGAGEGGAPVAGGGEGYEASLGGGATGFYGYGYVYAGEEGDSVSEILYRKERSTSRGREAFQSTGRGGLGNIRAASQSRDRPASGPDDFSVTRGREPAANQNPPIFSTGRGGAGNLRSPSRQPKDATLVEEEQEVIREYVASQEHAIHSSGRGGIGNMNRSRSRDPTSTNTNTNTNTHAQSRSPAPAGRYSTGRGGAGNILSGDEVPAELLNAADEEERKGVLSAGGAGGGGIHSTGRGGNANLTNTHEPPVEHHPHQHPHGEFESTGRGGAGNIHERD